MAYSYIRYAGNGSTTNYTFSFPYISADHIQVRVNGVLTTLFSFLNSSTVQMNSAPASGAILEIRRVTPKDNAIVNFTDGSVLLERDLDLLASFDLYLAQETKDDLDGSIKQDSLGVFDALNKRIGNVADPVNAQDAATKAWSETGMTAQLSQATTQATAAAGSATAAAGSASAAATSASNASTSASNAATSATAAVGSATSAANSATAAGTSATNANTSALASASSANAAGTSASNAASSASAAAASYDAFDDRYLGAKAVAPTLDNDGNALLVGSLYWDTGLQQMLVWKGATWAATFLTGSVNRSLVIATAAQTVVSTPTYSIGINTLTVFVNGVKLLVGLDYTETSQNSITFTSGLTVGDEVGLEALQPYAIGTTGAESVSFQQAGTGASQRNVGVKLKEFVSVKDFGAVGDGTTDDTASIQAAINSGVKRLTSPAGAIYRITNTLSINSNSVVLDLNYCEILLDDASGLKSHIKLGDGTVQRGGIRIKNIAFTRQQAATAGYAIDSDLIGVCEISGCRIYGNNEIWRGIRVNRGIIVEIHNNYIDNCVNTGIYLEGSGTGANRTVDVTIRENRVEGGVNALSTWDFVEGVFCRDNIFFNTSGVGVVVNASSNANGLVSFKFQENDFDTCGASGLFIDKVSNVQVTGCWFSNNVNDDLQLKEFTDSVVVVGNQFYPNASAINAFGNAARINGNLISGGTTCINVSSTATRTGISGNTLSNAQYGVNLSTATNTHFVGNSIYGMSAGAIANNGGSGTVVQNNKGDSGVGGNSFITVGASPFTYTAGPRPEYVSIFAGTVGNIQLGSNSIGFSTNRSVMLAPGQSVTVTYSSVPYMVKNQL